MYLLLPLVAAAIYTVSALFFKQAYARGVGPNQAFYLANILASCLFVWLWMFGGSVPAADLWRPAFIACLHYIGGWATFLAMRKGDVSLVTPVLGSKIVFVALFEALVAGQVLPWTLWVAALAASGGIFLIGFRDFRQGRGSPVAFFLAIASCLCFGISDIFTQMWGTRYGGLAFLGANAAALGVYSLIHAALTGPRQLLLPAGTRVPVLLGSCALAAQGFLIAYSLMVFNDATGVNVVYATRGLWSLVLVWFAGKWFENHERRTSRDALLWRAAGSALVLAAVALAFAR